MRTLGESIFDDDSFPGIVWLNLPEEDQNDFLNLRSRFFSKLKLDFLKILPKIYRFVFRNAEYYAERGIIAGFFFCGPFYIVDFRQLKKFICLSKSEIESKLHIIGYEIIKTYETQILLRKIFPQLEGNEVMLNRWIFFSATESAKSCFLSPFPDIGMPVLNLAQINPSPQSKPAKYFMPGPMKLITYVKPPPPPPSSPLPSLATQNDDNDELNLLVYPDEINPLCKTDTPFDDNDFSLTIHNDINDPYYSFNDSHYPSIDLLDIQLETDRQKASIWGSPITKWNPKRSDDSNNHEEEGESNQFNGEEEIYSQNEVQFQPPVHSDSSDGYLA